MGGTGAEATVVGRCLISVDVWVGVPVWPPAVQVIDQVVRAKSRLVFGWSCDRQNLAWPPGQYVGNLVEPYLVEPHFRVAPALMPQDAEVLARRGCIKLMKPTRVDVLFDGASSRSRIRIVVHVDMTVSQSPLPDTVPVILEDEDSVDCDL